MTYRITRSHEIHCGHRVYKHESKCAHLHGHSYVFDFTCEGALDAVGRVLDFSAVKERLCAWLETNWDHRFLIFDQDPLGMHLLDIDYTVVRVPFNPTAENIAAYMVEMIGPLALAGTGVRLVACTVHETSKCSATYAISGE